MVKGGYFQPLLYMDRWMENWVANFLAACAVGNTVR